jgi:hypothetical protein
MCAHWYSEAAWTSLREIYALDFCVLGYDESRPKSGVVSSASAPALTELSPPRLTERFRSCCARLPSERFKECEIIDQGIRREAAAAAATVKGRV